MIGANKVDLYIDVPAYICMRRGHARALLIHMHRDGELEAKLKVDYNLKQRARYILRRALKKIPELGPIGMLIRRGARAYARARAVLHCRAA